MSDWHAVVIKLGKIESLVGSDFLEITTVMNEYPVIMRKGEFQEGQLAAFIPYDSVVPDNEFWYWLAKPLKRDKDGTILVGPPPVGQVPEKNRTIKSKRVRGTYSEGLIVEAPLGFQEGDSVVEHFGLTKRVYEEELPETFDAGNEQAPKTFTLSKYDLDGLAKYGYVFQEGENVLITEKIEGENCTFIYSEDRLWVRSRNWFKREEEGSRWWELPHRLNLAEKLKNFPELAVWGELYGNVKHFKYDCPVVNNQIQRKFRIFDIWDIKQKRFLEWGIVEHIAIQLDLDTVPILYQGPFKNDDALHQMAEGTSTIGTCVREGIVIRSVPEAWDPKLGRKIIKLKGRGYKLFKD
jgi:RNA ligase (TIGR02306 family)